MELRVRGERAVLKGHGEAYTREIDPHSLALGAELADALHEWARVASAVRRALDAGEPGEAAPVVSHRGRQLAARVATVMGTPVHYIDPVTDELAVVPPTPVTQAEPSLAQRLFGGAEVGHEPTPWGTGLVVAGFVAAVVITAMVALASALAAETAGWVVVLASVVVTAGLAPSLWLARRLPIVRWIALGAAAGCVLAWFGVLTIAL
ncbi:hypothetical protein FHX82_001955 [Amycolatopsis bartoniae]|uniref:DUF2537 domain-containing protein n=1 Tax=Amycolatopsis bartoniae TaxID=941986 RepID=A0A8H9M8P5_9PSEU|nr:DUF2537 domain-containing protein [Amycolatopsis bartoniae]MBB2934935.1 hypothetical protein [Amycolatopsis bartoniae]TVS99359.1 DUF2537 domain-containing protein [Amycolatopsis bartoniae]GHF43712.1 hypothetical protein GCM10017566_15690 [Amycolatopsis bartoniae]